MILEQARNHILVVEDHDDTREMIASLLAEHGFVVLQASNGREALDLLVSTSSDEPFLILLDLEMPVMTGWELLEVIGRYHRLASIPVVITSGSHTASEIVLRPPILAFLPKPASFTVLLDIVRRTAPSYRLM